MDMVGQGNQVEPVAHISDERLKHAARILQSAQEERPLVQKRLRALAQELARLLDEIELFDTVVYCGEAAACLLSPHDVLRVLAGSIMWEGGKWRGPWKKTKICKDVFWNKPSPAAEAALKRSTANGLEEWKDRVGRSIHAIYKRRADEANKANDSGKKC